MADTTHVNATASFSPQLTLMPLLVALTDDKHADVVRDYRERIMDALIWIDSDTEFWHLTRWGMEFLRVTKRAPKSMAGILEWFEVNPSVGGNPGMRDKAREALGADLESWASADFEQYKKCEDPEVIAHILLEAGRQRYHAHIHKVASNMATGVCPAASDSTDPHVVALVGMSLPDQARLYQERRIVWAFIKSPW